MKLHDCPVEVEEAPAPEGPRFPEMNALKDGFESKVVGVAEDADTILGRAREWYYPLKPQHGFHAWLVDQIAIVTLQIERCGRVERRLRDRAALRAKLFWEDDRRSEARALGAGLAVGPAEAVDALSQTPQGCDWMIERWALLAHAADVAGAWTPGQTQMAFDLLATPAEFRSGRPGDSPDLAGLARRQIASLRDHRAEVVPPDTLDRSLAEADLSDEPSPELKRVRRREEMLHRRLRWYIEQLDFESPRHRPRPGLYHQSAAEPKDEPKPEPAPEKPLEFWQVKPANPEDDLELPVPIKANRRQERLEKSEARREARRRRLDRRRA